MAKPFLHISSEAFHLRLYNSYDHCLCTTAPAFHQGGQANARGRVLAAWPRPLLQVLQNSEIQIPYDVHFKS